MDINSPTCQRITAGKNLAPGKQRTRSNVMLGIVKHLVDERKGLITPDGATVPLQTNNAQELSKNGSNLRVNCCSPSCRLVATPSGVHVFFRIRYNNGPIFPIGLKELLACAITSICKIVARTPRAQHKMHASIECTSFACGFP